MSVGNILEIYLVGFVDALKNKPDLFQGRPSHKATEPGFSFHG